MRDAKRFITSPKHQLQMAGDDFVSILLLGENYGYRMKSYGPISLVNIENKTLIEKQVDSIKASFVNFEIILCCGFDSERTIHFIRSKLSGTNIRIVENQIHDNSNCCESMRLCLNNTMNDKVIICSGELLLGPDHFKKVNPKVSSVVIQNENFSTNLEVGAIHNAGKLESMSLGIRSHHWSEIFCLSGNKIIKSLQSIISIPDYKNKFIFEAINELIKKHSIQVIDTSDTPITKVNNIKTLRKISRT